MYQGTAETDTGRPGSVDEKIEERVLRAPGAGIIKDCATIGDLVAEHQVVTTVDGQEVRADISGILRGMIRSGTLVPAGVKIGDVDPHPDSSHCHLVSDKALAIAGGVLGAMLSATAKARLAYG